MKKDTQNNSNNNKIRCNGMFAAFSDFFHPKFPILFFKSKYENYLVVRFLWLRKVFSFPKTKGFPKNAQNIIKKFSQDKNSIHKRVAVFAGFRYDGKISDAQVYYLRELKKVCDNIVFISDCPVIESELSKIKDIVSYCAFKRHDTYDFGSYKIGYEYLKNNGLLEDADELILCNDSCYGPVYPFEKYFRGIDKSDLDFWGISTNIKPKRHIQSFFYVFKKQVFKSETFDSFIKNIKKEKSVQKVINNYEIPFTTILENAGFKGGSILPEFIYGILNQLNKTLYPMVMLETFECPLVKVKVFNNGFFDMVRDKPIDVLNYINSVNPELAKIIREENIDTCNK